MNLPKTGQRSVGPVMTIALFAILIFITTGPVITAQTASSKATGSPAAATVSTSTMPQAQIDEIVRAFTAKESRFRQALNTYAFKRDALVQTIGMGGQVTGEYHRVSQFTFDDAGNRFEKINYFPMPTLTEINITAQDLEDLGGVNPFALEGDKAALYNFLSTFSGTHFLQPRTVIARVGFTF